MADKKPEKKQECVQVVVRCRPFSTKEKKENRGHIIGIETASFQISLRNPSKPDHPPKHFTFDAVYDETTQQKPFYEESCYDLVEGVMEGYNGTIFAYGQTGCGKTHTMQGYNDPPELRGVIPHSFDHIFENIKGSVNTAFLIRCCYLEIYNEEVRDLLAIGGGGEKRDKLELKEDPSKGVYVKDLTQAVVSNQEGINLLMDQGQKMRTVGATAMNETSSRSHSIFTIVVEINDVDTAGKDHIRVGKLNLVDLAGSERASKTGASGDRLKEGCKINLSLSALGNVISALVDGKGKHIPYRDSKLTRLLQDSLGGNTKTLMVAAISPADYNYEETLSTLRYANRAKNIKNKPKINEDPKDAMLRQYKEEIEALKRQLAASLGAEGTQSNGGIDKQHEPTAPSSGGAAAAEIVSPPVGPETQLAERPTEEPRTPSSPLSIVASVVAMDQSVEHQPVGNEREDDPADDIAAADDVVALPEAAGADGQAQSIASPKGEVSTGEESPAPSAGRRGPRDGEVETLAERAAGVELARMMPPQSPDVVVQENIVERVVVEEKVVVQEVEVEVESQKMADHRQALENYSKAVEEQRNRLGQELETSVLRAGVEKQAREDMARKLAALQTKVIGLSSSSQNRRRARRESPATRGGDAASAGSADGEKASGSGGKFPGSPGEADVEDPEVIIARRNAEHRRMQAKLRQKRRKETRLELERVRALEEKAEVEKEMADVVGQAEEKERRLNKSRKKLERKLVEAREEIEDLAMEHETEREELLDSIRNQNKELQLWEQVARQILSSKEIARIWERGEYNEDDQTWILPHIKPRASYVGDTCKLPLLAPPGALHSGGGGVDEDANSQASGGNSARRDRRRGGGRSGGGEVRASISGGGAAECRGGGGGSRASTSGKGGDGGDRGGNGKRRRSVAGGRGVNDERPPRRAEDAAPKEGGGDIFNDVGKPRESLADREGGSRRSKGSPDPAITNLWGNGDSTADDHYRGLTPPISPSQGLQSRPRPSRSRGSFVDASDRNSRHSNHPESASTSSAAGWGFSGDGSRTGGGEAPSQDGMRGGGSRADRCPSRQGGTRAGTASGSRLGREHRQQLQQEGVPSVGSGGDPTGLEDSLLRRSAEATAASGGNGGEAVNPGGGYNGLRAKSRRNKSRPSFEKVAGESNTQQEQCWGDEIGNRKPTRSSDSGGGGKKERRPKSQAKRGERGPPERASEEHAAGYPSLLDSALWKGGTELDVGSGIGVNGSPPRSGADLYNFGS